MDFNSTAVSYAAFFMIDFYDRFKHSVQDSGLEPAQVQLAQSFAERMISDADPMETIEELATVHAATEFTIFLSDLVERLSAEEPTDIAETKQDLINDFTELYTLISEEEGFSEGIAEFVGDVTTSAPAEVPPVEESAPTPEPEAAPEPAKEEATRAEVFPFPRAFYTVLMENVSTDGLRGELLAALVGQLDKKVEILEQLIPSELSNIVQLMDESYANAGANLYTNAPLIESNVAALDDTYISELRAANYDVLNTVRAESAETSESLPEFKVSQIEQTGEKDPAVRGQLKDYFKNEVSEHVLDVKEIVSSVNIHTLIPNKFEQLRGSFTSLKDMCMIHGYDGLELIAEELVTLTNEGIADSLVFTQSSKHAFAAIVDSFSDLIEASDSDTEQDTVNTAISKLNTFNESLGVISVTEEVVYTSTDPEVRKALRQIMKAKVAHLTVSSNFEAIAEDFTLVELPTQAEFAARIHAADAALRVERLDEIRVMLTNDILKEDVDLFFEDETAGDAPEAQSTAAKTLGFADVMERPNMYASILSAKLGTLIAFFKEEDAEKITLFTADLEKEATMFGAPNIAELFSFYSLNLDAYLSDSSQIISEFDRYIESPENYTFQAENFTSSSEDAVTQAEAILSEEKTEHDDWISDVANVLENTEDHSADVLEEKIDVKPLFNDVDDDIREIFTEEASSYITAIQKQVDLLKVSPADKEALVMAEKAAHTLKGAAMMLSIETVGSIAEKLERIFEREALHEEGISSKKMSDVDVFLASIKDLMEGNVSSAEEKLAGVTASAETVDEDGDDDVDHDSEMLEIFQEESSENVEQIDLALTEALNDLENVQRFRQVESDSLSLKSAAKMLGFKNIGDLAEHIEITSEKVVKEELPLSTAIIEAMRNILHNIKELSLGHTINTDELSAAIAALSATAESGDRDVDDLNTADLFIEESIDVITEISEAFERLKSSPDQAENLTKLEQTYYQLGAAASAAGFATIASLCKTSEALVQKLIEENKPVPTSAISLLQRSISDLIKSSKLIEETQTDQSPSTETLIADMNAFLSPEESEENLEQIAEDTSETIKLRSQLNNKLESLNSLISDLENSGDEKADRTVILKSLTDIKSQVEHLQNSIAGMTESVESNTSKAKELSETSKSKAAPKTACHVYRINGEFYAIRSENVRSKAEINISDALIVENESHIFLGEDNHTLRSLADLLGISDPLPEQVEALSYEKNGAFFALTAPLYIGELELELQEINQESKRNTCDAMGFTENKELVFVITEGFLEQKLARAGKETAKSDAKVNKVKKKTVSEQNTLALVADDSVSIRRFMEEILSAIGFKVITATDGEDALQKFKENNVDVLITDIEMPHKDGYELIQDIRSDDTYNAIPLMVLTGRSSEKDREEALSRGANSYILKPFKEMELRQKLSEFFNFKKG